MSRSIRFTATLAAVLASVACSDDPAGPELETFEAVLNGDFYANDFTTDATGTATFTISADGTSVDYVLSVSGITGATAAHIHEGGADNAGGVLVGLFSSDPPTGDVDGALESGTFTGADYDGDLEDLLELMRSGDVYVNVHTEAHPGGEIRGQIMPSN